MTYVAHIDAFGQIVTSDNLSKVRAFVDNQFNTDPNSKVYPPLIDGET